MTTFAILFPVELVDKAGYVLPQKKITDDWRKFYDGQAEKKIFGCI